MSPSIANIPMPHVEVTDCDDCEISDGDEVLDVATVGAAFPSKDWPYMPVDLDGLRRKKNYPVDKSRILRTRGLGWGVIRVIDCAI